MELIGKMKYAHLELFKVSMKQQIKKIYIYRLDHSYPYWDYAIAFTLDLLNIDTHTKLFEKDYKKRFDEISNLMNYFGNTFKPHLFF